MGLGNLLMRLFGQCKFAGKCPIYDTRSNTCTQTRGVYSDTGYAECFVAMENVIKYKKTSDFPIHGNP